MTPTLSTTTTTTCSALVASPLTSLTTKVNRFLVGVFDDTVLKPEDIPGLAEANLSKLKLHGDVTTKIQLLGEFFKQNANSDDFAKWLTNDIGIQDQWSQKVARAFARRTEGEVMSKATECTPVTNLASMASAVVSKTFMQEPLRTDKLQPKMVPGIGPKSVEYLIKEGVDSVCVLMGHYLAMGRDDAMFKKFLVESGCDPGNLSKHEVINSFRQKSDLFVSSDDGIVTTAGKEQRPGGLPRVMEEGDDDEGTSNTKANLHATRFNEDHANGKHSTVTNVNVDVGGFSVGMMMGIFGTILALILAVYFRLMAQHQDVHFSSQLPH